MYKGVFVDDEDLSFARLLSVPGELEISGINPGSLTRMGKNLFNSSLDILVLDYRLDEVLGAESAEDTYKASALAQLIRDEATAKPHLDLPIVLVSSEPRLEKLYNPDKTAHDLFDKVYSKDFLTENRRTVQQEILSLVSAYGYLKGCNGSYDFKNVLGLTEGESHVVDFQELTVSALRLGAPHLIARLVLKDIIFRPGLLLDDADAAAKLGIDEASFASIASNFNSIQYDGVFSTGWRRWWAHRLLAKCEELFAGRPTSFTSKSRASVLSELYGKEVAAAESPWSGATDELVAFACASCRRPTEMRHSLSAFESNTPRYANRKRVCWDCVQKDTNLAQKPPILVDDSDATVAEKVRHMERPKTGEAAQK